MSSSNYFSHDSNARNDSKIIKLRIEHGAAGYGVYFMILERLRDESDYTCAKDYNMIAFDLRVDAELIQSVVEDFGLFSFTKKGERFYSDSFNRRMSIKDDIRKLRTEAGKKGIAKRWGCLANATEIDSKTIANATEIDSKTIANATEIDSKESKVKKSKEKKVSVETYNARTHDAHAREGSEKPPALTAEQKAKADKKVKYKYADYVSLTRDEYATLCAEHGEDPVKAMIEILNNYKGSKGKTYKSDYLAIKNWVINRYYEDIQRYGNQRTDTHARNGNENNQCVSKAALQADKGASGVGGAEAQKNYAERF